jgi:hypothetical protein
MSNCGRKRGSSDSPEFTPSRLLTDCSWTIILKVHPRTGQEGAEGGMGDQRHAPAVLPSGKTRYPMCRRLDGPQGRSGRVQKISPPTGIRSPDRPARSDSLYRLSYSGRLDIILVINGGEWLWNATSCVPTLHAWEDSQRYALYQTRKYQTTWITNSCVVSDICETVWVRKTTNYNVPIFYIPRLDMISK